MVHSSTTVLPLKSARERLRPFESVSVKAGAAAPMSARAVAGCMPALMHHPDALPQRDPRRGPARQHCPVDLEVVHASHMVNDAVAGRGYESRLTQRPGRVLKMNLTESEAI